MRRRDAPRHCTLGADPKARPGPLKLFGLGLRRAVLSRQPLWSPSVSVCLARRQRRRAAAGAAATAAGCCRCTAYYHYIAHLRRLFLKVATAVAAGPVSRFRDVVRAGARQPEAGRRARPRARRAAARRPPRTYMHAFWYS
jgi:hypothetical protein